MRRELNPKDQATPFVGFVRPRPGHPLTVRAAVREPIVSRMHRIARRSIPCLPDPCPFCIAKQPLDSRVYLLVRSDGIGPLIFVDLPAQHHEYLCGLTFEGSCLSQFMLKVSRLGNTDNSPIGIRPIGKFAESGDVFLQTWIDALLDRTFASNTLKALDFVNAVEKPSSTFAPSETSGPHGDGTTPTHRGQLDNHFLHPMKSPKRG